VTPARFALAVALLLPGVAGVQRHIDTFAQRFSERERPLFSEAPHRLKQLVPGFETLLADIYWLRTVQYYGSQRAFNPDPHYRNLRPLIDLTTTLDPRFELAYRYGAVFLSEALPIGAEKPEEGIEVLERGVRALPGSWRLRWDLGAHWFFFMKDARTAAAVLREAMHVPGAPYWLEALAARFLEGDDRASAREIWRRQYESGEGGMKENALYNLRVLDALDVRDAYNAAVQKFRESNGRPPGSLGELVRAGLVRNAEPRDPTGVPFVYDPVAGRVKLNRASALWRSKYE
jgi:hypothetical protein